MGVAQGMDILIDLAASFNLRPDVGFLFVGRGTDVPRLRANAIDRRLNNIIFHDEVDPGEIPALLSQCHIGLLALDPRHRTHNIPGKFLTYVQAGLPVLARINPDTDLAKIIENEGVGCAYVGDVVSELHDLAEELAGNRNKREVMSMQGRALSKRMFSPTTTVNQIVEALSGSN
jgi:glycosyltransferase involved in cell wall biosynthesis